MAKKLFHVPRFCYKSLNFLSLACVFPIIIHAQCHALNRLKKKVLNMFIYHCVPELSAWHVAGVQSTDSNVDKA